MRRTALVLALAIVAPACGGDDGPATEIVVPVGASFDAVADTLASRDVVGWPGLFGLYARMRGDDRRVRSGRYVIPGNASWAAVLDALTEGRVVTVPLTLPEGFRLVQMAPRIAEVSRTTVDSVVALLEATSPETLGLPGPGLEGFLFPDTYRFAPGVAPSTVLETLAARYRAVWTPERRARLDSLGMSERDLVTLASIVQAEARHVGEMPRIAGVYHNRLERGWLLQADPTVLYALGGPRDRLLFAAIDSVEDSPYNTYTQPGLPPGPIGAPGEAALDAALHPLDEDFMYFVARPDGSHVFTRTLAEHNRAVAAARRAWDSLRQEAGADGPGGGADGGA